MIHAVWLGLKVGAGAIGLVVLAGIVWQGYLYFYRFWNSWIRVNAKCPGCGNRKGELKQVMGIEPTGRVPVPLIEHHCLLCGTRWLEETIMNPKIWYQPPAEPVGTPPKK